MRMNDSIISLLLLLLFVHTRSLGNGYIDKTVIYVYRCRGSLVKVKYI